MEAEEISDLFDFAEERQQAQSWTNLTELAAQQVEVLGAVLQRLMGGIPVSMVKGKLGKQPEAQHIERPPWIESKRKASSEKVMTPREFFAAMRNR